MTTLKASLLGVPLDLGAENLGVDIGPNAFRYEGIAEKLETAGFSVTDIGNIFSPQRADIEIGNPKVKYLKEIIRVAEETAKIVATEIKNDHKTIVLGGDHSITLGTVSGASTAVEGDIGLIYLDAHGDMNTEATTLTGNIHGMHVASLLGFGTKVMVEVYSKQIKIAKQNFLHIGANDLDEGESAFIEKEKLDCYKIIDVLAAGIGPLLKKIDTLAGKVGNIWVSLDLDVIDAMYAPGAGMPNKGGLTYREITTIIEYIGKKTNVIGIDVVEYNPLQDIDGKTAELGIELIAKAFGKNYSWYSNYLRKNEIKS